MNILIVSNSFVVEESLGNLFNELFENSQIKIITSIYDIEDKELVNQDLIFKMITENKENVIKKLGYIKERNQNVKIIILDIYKCEIYFRKALEVDIDGYITAIADKEEFIFTINKVMECKKVYDPILLKSVVRTDYLNKREPLTRREKDVLNELGKGLSNKEISNNLYITENTVKKHISNILDKLHLRNRQEAILYLNQ